MRGEEAARKGVLILAMMGTCRLWPVAYENTSFPTCSVGLPASLWKVVRSFSRRSFRGLKAIWNDPDSYKGDLTKQYIKKNEQNTVIRKTKKNKYRKTYIWQ